MMSKWTWMPAALTLIIALIGALLDWTAFLRSWLAATLALAALPLGAQAILMMHGLTGGRWGHASRPLLLALAGTTPVLVVSLIPLLFGLDTLFSWTRPEAELPEVVRNKLPYLNAPFFIVRTLFYCALWLGLTWLIGTWRKPWLYINAPGLILWVLALTFFGFDWFQSLEPRFYSDVFALMLGANMVAAVFALVLGVGQFDMPLKQDLAHLWATLLLGWVFLAFSQYIIIWSGNLPHEIGWYVHRGTGIWRGASWLVFLLFFLVPFVLILVGLAKQYRGWLVTASISCLAGHLLYVHWLVLPAFEHWLVPQFWFTPILVVALAATYLGIAYSHWNRGRERHA